MQTLFYPLALGVATMALIALSWHYWRNVKQQGATWLVTLLALWALCEVLRLTIANVTLKIILLRLSFLSRGLVPVAWVFATREFARKPPLSRRQCWLLLLVPLLTQAVIWTIPLHRLFWRDEIAAAQTLWWAMPTTLYGPWFWIHTAYSYAVAVLGALPLLEIARHSTQRYREQAWFALLGALMLGCASAPVMIKGAGPRNYLPADVLMAGMALLCT
ncbi:MAG TPA: histidine kinase N-terminal 7TM domain-containing protein, partial [Anaerolineae bacterium]|nr:histidine kinase N-terminal 7TM domain-containing protein [Anaerolineae bacterium]